MAGLSLNKMKQDEQSIQHEGEEMVSLTDHNTPSINVEDRGPPWWRSQRYILAYLLFGGMMNIFFQRVNFNIAIICMVNHTAISCHSHHVVDNNSSSNKNTVLNFEHSGEDDNYSRPLTRNESTYFEKIYFQPQDNKSLLMTDFVLVPTATVNDKGIVNSSIPGCETESCSDQLTVSKEKMEDGPLIWDKELQGLLLGAVYWTYLLVQIPANIVVRKAKKKTVVLFSMILMSIMTMLMHVAALWSPWAVFAVKLVQGACTALIIIAMYAMWGKWAPPSERGSLITLAMSGQNLGNIIVFPLSALLCKHGFLGGWPSIFYVFGGIGFVWIALFFLFSDESPLTHRFITQEERKYITSTLSHSPLSRQPKVPWTAIMTSPPFWGIVIGQFSFTWGLLLILSTLPQYMLEVLKFDIKSNGVFTMLPYIALLFVTQAAGGISDFVIRRKFLSVLWTRKLCVLIANLVPAALLAGMSFLDHSQAGLAITLLVIAVGASGFSLSGFLVSPYDIAPRFATEMMIIINTVATIPGILANYVVAAVTKDQMREQWQIVYFLTSAIYVLGALCFCLLSRGIVQPWALDGESHVIKEIIVDRDDKKNIIKEAKLMLNDC